MRDTENEKERTREREREKTRKRDTLPASIIYYHFRLKKTEKGEEKETEGMNDE